MSEEDVDTRSDELPDPETLAGELLDAAAMGDFERELARIRATIEARRDELEPLAVFRYCVVFFDLAMVSTLDPLVRFETAAGLLSGAIEAGQPAWEAIRRSNRLDEIERLTLEQAVGVELLELLAYAPDAGMRGFAINQIGSSGMRALDNWDDSRSFERLLHAIGATEDAYRLESVRKQRLTNSAAAREHRGPSNSLNPAYRVVALAGGHAQLRGTAARLLQQHGIETVPIPSSREAVRRERDIVRLLQGCNLVMLLVRQITHSTSDQVRKAAERLGVPVVYSNALSAVAIERQLLEFAG